MLRRLDNALFTARKRRGRLDGMRIFRRGVAPLGRFWVLTGWTMWSRQPRLSATVRVSYRVGILKLGCVCDKIIE